LNCPSLPCAADARRAHRGIPNRNGVRTVRSALVYLLRRAMRHERHESSSTWRLHVEELKHKLARVATRPKWSWGTHALRTPGTSAHTLLQLESSPLPTGDLTSMARLRRRGIACMPRGSWPVGALQASPLAAYHSARPNSSRSQGSCHLECVPRRTGAWTSCPIPESRALRVVPLCSLVCTACNAVGRCRDGSTPHSNLRSRADACRARSERLLASCLARSPSSRPCRGDNLSWQHVSPHAWGAHPKLLFWRVHTHGVYIYL
jgi:hypothetical protein